MRIQGQSGKHYRKSVASAVKLRDACEKVDVLGFNRGFILTAVLFNDIGFSLYEIKENYIGIYYFRTFYFCLVFVYDLFFEISSFIKYI